MCCSKLKTFKNNGLTALQTLGGRSIIICIFLCEVWRQWCRSWGCRGVQVPLKSFDLSKIRTKSVKIRAKSQKRPAQMFRHFQMRLNYEICLNFNFFPKNGAQWDKLRPFLFGGPFTNNNFVFCRRYFSGFETWRPLFFVWEKNL